MTLILWIRLMADLSFYYAYAGFFVSLAGSAFCLPGIVLPSLCCALPWSAGCRFGMKGFRAQQKSAAAPDAPGSPESSSDSSGAGTEGREGRLLRMILLLPSLICFVLPGIGTGDRIALLPALFYLAALAWTDRYSFSYDRQKDVFLLFLKTYPPFFILAAALGGYRELISSSLPPAVLTMVLCVWLLRTLRHEPKIYRNPRFLSGSSLSLAAILGGAFLLQLRTVTDALTAAAMTFYTGIAVPLLSALLYAAAFLFTLIVTPLLSLAGGEGTTTSVPDFSMGEIMNETDLNAGSGSPLAARILNVLGITLVCVFCAVLLLLLFRRLAGDKDTRKSSDLSIEERRLDLPHSQERSAEHLPRSPLHPVNRIRRQYRRYLQICRRKGFEPYPFHTSQDISRGTAGFFPDPSCAERLRELYIQARYHGVATPEGAAEARDLVRRIADLSPGPSAD